MGSSMALRVESRRAVRIVQRLSMGVIAVLVMAACGPGDPAPWSIGLPDGEIGHDELVEICELLAEGVPPEGMDQETYDDLVDAYRHLCEQVDVLLPPAAGGPFGASNGAPGGPATSRDDAHGAQGDGSTGLGEVGSDGRDDGGAGDSWRNDGSAGDATDETHDRDTREFEAEVGTRVAPVQACVPGRPPGLPAELPAPAGTWHHGGSTVVLDGSAEEITAWLKRELVAGGWEIEVLNDAPKYTILRVRGHGDVADISILQLHPNMCVPLDEHGIQDFANARWFDTSVAYAHNPPWVR